MARYWRGVGQTVKRVDLGLQARRVRVGQGELGRTSASGNRGDLLHELWQHREDPLALVLREWVRRPFHLPALSGVALLGEFP
jgi:hypothetical protein